MKITLKNQTQLTIRHCPIGSWIYYFFVPIAMGILLVFVPHTEPEEFLSYYFPAYVVWGFSLLFGSFSKTTQVTIWAFDKSLETLIVKQRRLLGTKTFQYSLQDICEVEIDSPWDQVGHGIKLLLSEKRVLRLCYGDLLFRDEAEEWVEIISTFLKA
ncbi:hypothetical protein [Lusitaniella coriacea]|uniref:hypothetical protein n=1 Tax=Lusitaniella coriacea TaxID=1983105 RepID=UPI003CE91A96